MTFFIIGVFGRTNKTLEKLPKIEVALLKIALSATASGSLFNVLSFSTPQPSEIVLNVGLGMLFIWTAFFHWKYFVKKKN
jgi:phosphotransferase system  glucose/maltose/N-acetylglucosamine-specific IIC component